MLPAVAASILASLTGATAYNNVPAALAAKISGGGCVLPTEYVVRGFAGRSSDAGATLGSFGFGFEAAVTRTSTRCAFNASTSVSTTPDGLTPRFACRDADVKFIWQDAPRSLFMVQRVCPDAGGGVPAYEVSGSVVVPLSCDGGGLCVANQTAFRAAFTSIQHVRDPTAVAGRRRGARAP